jgi:hypothetical protein
VSPIRASVSVLALGLLLSACTVTIGGPDIDALEQAIVETGDEQRPDLGPWTAECPDAPDSLSQGDTFTCTATSADGSDFVVTVTATDDDGNVDFSF